MEIPKTTTATAASSIQPGETTEIHQNKPTIENKSQESTLKDSKAAQGLAGEAKGNQNLQAEIQKSQLNSKLSKPVFQNIDQLSVKHKLDEKQTHELKAFAKEHGVPEQDLIQVGNNQRYSGSEKLEAMKAYAIAYDAANNGKLEQSRSAAIKNNFLPNLLEGKIGIRQKEMTGARAQYNSRNEGNKAGYEANTMSFPKEGLNLNSAQDRSTLIHEANHVAQDASKRKMSFMESEASGHAAGMDYLLRDRGAFEDTPKGPKLNFDKFNEILQNTKEYTDRKQLVELFAQAAERNEREGKKELNGVLSDAKDVGYLIRSQDSYVSKKSFEDLYIRSVKEDPKNTNKSDFQLRQEYNHFVPHDGIDD